MSVLKEALERYDTLRKQLGVASGLGAVLLTTETLNAADEAIRLLRDGEPVRPQVSGITVMRQRLVSNKMSMSLNDRERVNYLHNSASDDNDHNVFENWDIVGLDIIYRGPVEEAGRNRMQQVIALVTEKRVAKLD